nr:hypothetical protein CFP56_56747 [Quercus suber]
MSIAITAQSSGSAIALKVGDLTFLTKLLLVLVMTINQKHWQKLNVDAVLGSCKVFAAAVLRLEEGSLLQYGPLTCVMDGLTKASAEQHLRVFALEIVKGSDGDEEDISFQLEYQRSQETSAS